MAAAHPPLLLLACFLACVATASGGNTAVEKFTVISDHQLHHAQVKLEDQTMCVFSYSASGNENTEDWEILLVKQADVYKCIIDRPQPGSEVNFIQFAASILENEIITAEAFDSEGVAMLQDDEYEVTIDAVRCIMGQFRGGLSKLNLKSK